MNTNKLKLSWNGSDWTQSIEGDTGTSIALFTTTTTSLLSVLTMVGFAVLQVVLEDTSIHSLDMKYAPDIARKQHEKLGNNEIGLICGSVSTYWNPMSREYRSVISTNLDGDGSQEVLVYHPESSSPISTTVEQVLSSSRFDTLTEATAVLRSLQAVHQQFTERSV